MVELTKAQQYATVVIEQLGELGKLRAMISAHSFMTNGDNELQFSFKGSRKAKKAIITLDASDTYTMRLGKLNRKLDWVEAYNESGLYWDMLKPEFEKATGLYLSL